MQRLRQRHSDKSLSVIHFTKDLWKLHLSIPHSDGVCLNVTGIHSAMLHDEAKPLCSRHSGLPRLGRVLNLDAMSSVQERNQPLCLVPKLWTHLSSSKPDRRIAQHELGRRGVCSGFRRRLVLAEQVSPFPDWHVQPTSFDCVRESLTYGKKPRQQ